MISTSMPRHLARLLVQLTIGNFGVLAGYREDAFWPAIGPLLEQYCTIGDVRYNALRAGKSQRSIHATASLRDPSDQGSWRDVNSLCTSGSSP